MKFYNMTKQIAFSFLLTLTFTLGISQNRMDWFHLDASEGFNGISSKKLHAELAKKEGRPIVVAIIDSGIDILHPDLKDNIWVNAGEVPDNGIDDDKNGYIDDVYGWNFIGGPNNQNVGPDTYESTRVYAALKYKYQDANPLKLNKDQKAEYELFLKVKEQTESKRKEAEESLAGIATLEANAMKALDLVQSKLNEKNLSVGEVGTLDVSESTELAYGVRLVKNVVRAKGANSIESIKEFISIDIIGQRDEALKSRDVSFNPDFDPRKTIVKDNYANKTEKIYGNNDVSAPDALHGTHVAGIVGAIRGNNVGMDGVAKNVKLMSIRTVPDGDERDKDVANAIRYAVDNGASIINMSFGKAYSPEKSIVDEAVKYAEANDVLLVHAAGNSAANNDTEPNFPNDYLGKSGFIFKKKRYAKNWIEVGALNYKKDADMVAGFSNFGKANVDIFAPGMQIFSTTPNEGYQYLQGTSMASPVVAGVAAVLRSYFPMLTAVQVKDIIMKSSTTFPIKVKTPGSGTEVLFSELSVSGGVINVYNAYKMAETVKGQKKAAKNTKGA
jgi:cell wall-associated protease